jgi:hypothetical protein
MRSVSMLTKASAIFEGQSRRSGPNKVTLPASPPICFDLAYSWTNSNDWGVISETGHSLQEVPGTLNERPFRVL